MPQEQELKRRNPYRLRGGAEEASTSSLTIENPAEGHQYKAYQVFKGTVSSDGTKLSNVQYGANYAGREGMALDEELAQLEAEGADAKAFAETVRNLLTGDPAAVLTKENPAANLEAGYYIIIDESTYEGSGDSLSDYIVAVAGNVKVQPKSTGVPGFDKSIDEGEDEPQAPDNPDDPATPPFEVPEDADISPETADIDWNYTLHEDTGVITLNYYIGTKTDVKVYSHYKVPDDDRVWKAELASNTGWIWTNNYMFSDRKDIASVTFSNSLDTSTCTGMGSMFKYCGSLTNIDFGTAFNTANVTDMNGMFNGCTSLDNLDVSKFDTRNVTDMGGMFSGCSSLSSIDVSEFNTSNVTNMHGMFWGCSNIKFIDLKGLNTSMVTTMSVMFEGCSALKSVDISDIDTSMVTNMQQMFASCSSLTDINISGIDTSNVEFMQSMFAGTAVSSLDLTDFNTVNAKDMSTMFGMCRSLKNIYVTKGKWVTDQADTTNMFYACGTSSVIYATPTASAVSAVIMPEVYASDLTAETSDEEAALSDAIEIEDDDTSVSYGIGDSIPYKLTATMPESITAYKKYQLVFHDKLSAGLDYNRDSLKVFAGGTEIPAENYTVAYSEDGKSLTVSINDAKAAPWNAVPGTEISVKYSAVLNENAEVKNRNEAWLEYSNDPKGDGTGETGPGVPDTVDVYTFEIRFDKVDKNGDPLSGAGFTLYKKDEADVFQPFGEEVKGVTRFSFKGLSAGEYKLVETTTPDGYNTMEDFVFRIDAETADGTDGKVKRITMIPVSGGAGAWTAVAADMAFESDIANYTGSTLPSTGGMGTYAFYLAGAAVVVTVGTVMAAKKKEDKE